MKSSEGIVFDSWVTHWVKSQRFLSPAQVTEVSLAPWAYSWSCSVCRWGGSSSDLWLVSLLPRPPSSLFAHFSAIFGFLSLSSLCIFSLFIGQSHDLSLTSFSCWRDSVVSWLHFSGSLARCDVFFTTLSLWPAGSLVGLWWNPRSIIEVLLSFRQTCLAGS